MTEGMSLSQINLPTINMNNAEVANNPNDKASGEEYFDRRGQQQENQEQQQSPFVDRTAQLRATLNSLAALNAANVVQAKDKYKVKAVKKEDEEQNQNQNQNEQNDNNQDEQQENSNNQNRNKVDNPITKGKNLSIES